MSRLDRLKGYLDEAMEKPEENKFYIEDLKLSIKYEKKYQSKNIEVKTGFALTEE